MDGDDFREWMKSGGLLERASKCSGKLKGVFTENLKVEKECVFVLTDLGNSENFTAPTMGYAYYKAAMNMGLDVKVAVETRKSSSDPMEPHVIEALDYMEKGIIILSVSNKIGEMGKLGKSFRMFARKRGHRFISSTGLGSLDGKHIGRLIQAIGIDYKNLQDFQDRIRSVLESSGEVRIKTKAGTDIYARIKSDAVVSNDGRYSSPGSGGNMPVGEVYFAPVKGSVEGSLIIDGSSRNSHGTKVVKEPVKIEISKGKVVEISGGKEARLVESSLTFAEERAKHPKRVRSVGEIGFGFNPSADIVGAMIIDEKARNTGHLAIGSNYWFGGDVKTILHLDQVFRNPCIEVDGDVLETRGYS